MRMPFLVAAVDRALRQRRPARARRDARAAALSGGADSVALADALASLQRRRGFRLVAAHLDHGLRPGSADDAAFCLGFCATLGVPFRAGSAACAPARAARRAASSRPRATSATRSCAGCRTTEGRRGDRGRAHAGRPGRDAAAAPAARRRRERPRRRCAPRAATCCARCSRSRGRRFSRTCAPGGSRGARIPRTPIRRTCATACATSCSPTSSSASTRASAKPSRGRPPCSPTRRPTSGREAEGSSPDREPRRRGAGPGSPAARRARRWRWRGRAVRLALQRTGGLVGVDRGHVDRVLRVAARRRRPAGGCAFPAAGKPASLTDSFGSKSVPSRPRKPYHRPGPNHEGQDLRPLHGGADRPARGRAGRGDHQGLRQAGRSASSA